MSENEVSRRRFLGMAAAGAAMVPLNGSGLLRMAAGPRQVLVPADKKISASWIAGLTKRGVPTVYRGKALANIGMPIGGIGCGQVYLGGDGRLWNWDLFGQFTEGDMGQIRNGLHYSEPMKPESPFAMGFYLARVGEAPRSLDDAGFPEAEFAGSYPMAKVNYGEHEKIAVELEAYSPFIPLNADDSGLPVAIMSYRVTNRDTQDVDLELVGWTENPACLFSRKRRDLTFDAQVTSIDGWTFLQCRANEAKTDAPARDEIVFEDFEKDTYEGWKVEGTAFGSGPIALADIPKYQGDVKGTGKRVVNSHYARQGEDVSRGDAHVGKLTSRSFKIDRHYVSFLIGGGNHPGKTCVNLVVDGKVVRTETGRNSNAMALATWDVRDLAGKDAFIEIVDDATGAWGNIGVDQIVFTDRLPNSIEKVEDEYDFGTFGIGLSGDGAKSGRDLGSWAKHPKATEEQHHAIGKRLTLKPGESQTVTFIVAWHFPTPNRRSLASLQRSDTLRRYYAKRFADAEAVGRYVATNFERLERETRLWTKTWYDSSLPYWFLDRTMANTSTLSTATCYRFDDGRFYAWEGTYCCPGTCTHVWQYAQSVGRIFPELERDTRERVDYGIAYHENGGMGHRAEFWQDPATDGQFGTILRVLREHQMTSDMQWLRKMWPRVKKSLEYMIAQDPNLDGVLEGPQFNTLDATWYGKIAWLSSLYVAALRAGEQMALDMGDLPFAGKCRAIAEQGMKRIATDLFNGEYFIQIVDPNHLKAINTNDGCHVDQVFGQSWAFQVGLPRVLPADKTKKALKSLYRYSFTPDAGKYRDAMKAIKGGRWYALAGEPGLLMCTWPRGGAEKAPGVGQEDWAVGYFNECMTGFEHQVASHMIYEGMVEEGLIIERAIHDRYDAAKRNPYNEIECGDHYARAMASYGVYLAACGFEYHGPKETIAFAPRMGANKFRAAFTAAAGWGSYAQTKSGSRTTCTLEVKWGRLDVKTLKVALPKGAKLGEVDLDGKKIAGGQSESDGWIHVNLAKTAAVSAGQKLTVRFDGA